MAEIRFPLRGRGSRRSTDTEATADPLEAMALQIRALDAAAELAAVRIAEAAAGLGNRKRGGGSATRADLLAGLASALVDRTEEIRADCGRLSSLMDRTAKLVADRDATADTQAAAAASPDEDPEEEPEAFDLTPEPPLDLGPLEPDLAPESPSAPEPPRAQESTSAQRELSDPEAEQKPNWLSRSRPGAPGAGTSEGVRLIATQMAIAGSSRAEIERRLRIQFGVIDADQALDEIFGHRRTEVG